jgi:hypothetical protein
LNFPVITAHEEPPQAVRATEPVAVKAGKVS